MQPSTSVVTGNITIQNANPNSGVPTAGSTLSLVLNGAYNNLGIQVMGTYTGALSVQVTIDGVNWVTLAAATAITNVAAGTQAATIASATPGVYSIGSLRVLGIRVTALAAMTGTAVVSLLGTRT